MKELLNQSAAFAISYSILSFMAGLFLYRLTKNKWYNFLFSPLIVSLVILIPTILVLGLSDEAFIKNTSVISFFLSPVVVMMAPSIYKNFHFIKKYFIPIIGGILIGSLTGVLSVYFLSKALSVDLLVIKSLLAKSITAPMAMDITKEIGGIPSIVLLGVIVAGNIGASLGPTILELLHVKHPVSKGVAIGTASHAVGTSKAIELGEIEGTMSSLSIAICGICTVIWIPVLMLILHIA